MGFLQLLVDGIATGAILALVAVGLSLIFRLSHFINIAHVDLATLGAYFALFITLYLELPFIVSVCLAVGLTALIGYASFRFVYSKYPDAHSITLIIVSIGLAFIYRYTGVFFWGSNQRSFPIPLMRAYNIQGISITLYDLLIIAISLICFLLIFVILAYTHFGRALRAIADNPSLARVSGFSSNHTLAGLWLLASALAGLGGILLGIKTVITPYMGWNQLIPAFAALVLGGVGSVGGTLIAALLLGIVGELAATYWMPTYRLAAFFGVIVLVLAVRPSGLFGTREVAK